MTPQELRNSILQLAFQGKLVPQNETEIIIDGTAFLLDDAPYDIPGTWKWNTIGKCCELYTGNSISEREKKSKYEGLKEGYDYIGTKDVSFAHTIAYDNGIRIPFDTDFKIAYKGTVLLCIEGGSAGRKIAVLDRDVCFGNKLCMFKGLSVQNTFLYYYLQSTEFKSAFIDNMTGIIGGVSIKRLKTIVLPIPPLAEQKRIVAKIEELMPLVDRYEEAWNRLEELNKRFPDDLQKSILQQAIQGNLVPQRPEEGTGEELYQEIQKEKEALLKAGKIKREKEFGLIGEDEIPFDIPDNWTWVRFGNLGNYKKGPFGSALTKGIFVPKGKRTIKVYEQKNAIQKDVSLGEYYITRDYYESKMKGFKVEAGDIIVSCAGTIGETYILPNNLEEGIINQALMRMRIFSPMYIPYFLTYFDVALKNYARKSSKGSAIKNIPPFSVLKNYLVPLPPFAEQKRIVNEIEELLPLCKKLELLSV